MHLLLLHAETNINIIATNAPSFEVSNDFIFTYHYHDKQKKIMHLYFRSFFEFQFSLPLTINYFRSFK